MQQSIPGMATTKDADRLYNAITDRQLTRLELGKMDAQEFRFRCARLLHTNQRTECIKLTKYWKACYPQIYACV